MTTCSNPTCSNPIPDDHAGGYCRSCSAVIEATEAARQQKEWLADQWRRIKAEEDALVDTDSNSAEITDVYVEYGFDHPWETDR